MSGDNVNDVLEAEERDGAGMEAPSHFSSCSCPGINLMVCFLLLDGMAMLCSERKLRIFFTRGSSSCSSCALPVLWWTDKKLAHFGKLTENDEATLSGLLALARATLPMIKPCSGEVRLSWTRSKYLSCFCPCLW